MPPNSYSELLKKVEFYRHVTEKHNLINPYNKIGKRIIRLCPPPDVRKYWSLFLETRSSPFLSLYVHVPYCRKTKCRYCMYRSKIIACESELDDYLDYIEEEAEFYSAVFDRHPFATVHIGGGTPTLLDENRLRRLLTIINGHFSFSPTRTCTLEIKPSHTTEAQLETALALGCNRISIGVQSFNRNALELAHRDHVEIHRVKKLVDFLYAHDICEINVDLIGGLPGDDPEGFRETFRQAASLGISTITIYFFRLENSRYNKKIKARYADYCKSEYTMRFLDALDGVSSEYGYTNITRNPYSVYQLFVNNNFNLKLERHPTEWFPEKQNSLLGLGIGARSFILNIVSFINCGPHGLSLADISDALEGKPELYLTKYSMILDSEIERMRDYVLRSFYLAGCVSLLEFKKSFNKNMYDVFGQEIKSLQSLGKLAADNQYLDMLCEGFERAVLMKFFYDQEELMKLVEKEPVKSYLSF
ncbi:MAG: radical SAM protein [bacterium]